MKGNLEEVDGEGVRNRTHKGLSSLETEVFLDQILNTGGWVIPDLGMIESRTKPWVGFSCLLPCLTRPRCWIGLEG